MDYCPNGHPITSAADRNADGWCKQCRKAKSGAYRRRQSAALQLASALEANGIPITQTELQIDLSALADALARGYNACTPSNYPRTQQTSLSGAHSPS